MVRDMLVRVSAEDIAFCSFASETPECFAGRILRACKWILEDAVKRVADTKTWRVSKDVNGIATRTSDDLLDGACEDELAAFDKHAYLNGVYDKYGRPIYIQRTGIVDAESILSLTTLEHMEDYHIFANEVQLGEVFAAASTAAGRPISSLLTILDMEGMSMSLFSAHARHYIARTAAIDSSYYPETLGAMYIINAPAIFTAVWNVIRGWLDPGTVAKIFILGGPSSWKPKLAEVLAPEATPVEYGGRFVTPGGLFPESRTKTTSVSSGKVHREVVPASAAGTTARFRWFSKSGSLRYSVIFVPAPVGASPPSLVVYTDATQKVTFAGRAGVDAGVGGESLPGAVVVAALAEMTCERVNTVTHTATGPGAWVVTWDNSKAWRGRDITHRWDYMVEGAPECSLRELRRAQAARAAVAAGGAAPAASAGGAATSASGAGGV